MRKRIGVHRTLAKPAVDVRTALFLFSDTGGGHRTAAQAIAAALSRMSPADSLRAEMVDVFAACGVFPLREGIKSYGTLLKVRPSPYSALYHLSNGRTRTRIMTEFAKPFMRGKFRRLLARMAPSMLVSVHPLLNGITRESIDSMRMQVPFVTVITDLVTIHHSWTADAPADHYIVASPEAKRVCLARDIPESRVHDLGLPIREGFHPVADSAEAKRALGLDVTRKTLLMMAGGEGGGRLFAILRHIAPRVRALGLQLVAIAGRNLSLQRRLQKMAAKFGPDTRVVGFVDNVAEYMRASDALLTKAGPGAICEAAACGLPIIVCDYISGQEAGNLAYVESREAGIVALEPEAVDDCIRRLFGADGSLLKRLREGALASARPRAADDIARFLLRLM
ncbi:MAG TPA: glycosyltransferase [Candidatus Tumulicola sp.]|nr:glycosyltransferase [Candidatus Tumulicola sp.]